MANQKHLRNNAWNSGGTFDNQDLLWYAKGVKQMMSRPIADPQSWWFYAAIHGELANPNTDWYKDYSNSGLSWAIGLLWKNILTPPASATTPLPSDTVMQQYWNQCQHQSWYFLPWHRGYLLSLEQQLRQDIIAQGGPASWALPYWDYFGDNGKQFRMPSAFAQPTLPDTTPNPLYVKMRYGLKSNGDIFIPIQSSNTPNDSGRIVTQDEALKEKVFTPNNGLEFGFGGPKTAFNHTDGDSGKLENNPHNIVHTCIGGVSNGSPTALEGLMGDPNTAALDPIFYLHHANIDRLWASWSAAGNANSADPAWLDGPSPQFVMPTAAGQPWIYTPKEMNSLDPLDYQYQELTPIPASSPLLATRLQLLEAAPQLKAAFENAPTALQTEPRATTVELMGASSNNLVVQGEGLTVPVTLEKSVQEKSTSRFKSFKDFALMANNKSLKEGRIPAQPDKVFLKLEQITGSFDTTIFNVYVHSTAAPDTGGLAGAVSLFGLRLASLVDGKHGGGGLSFTLNITPIIDQLHLDDNFTASDLRVSIASLKPLTQDQQVQIGRISVYRQAF